jgi:hypothetical protein
MPETPTFPILPVDRRFLERLDRFRNPVSREYHQPTNTAEAEQRLRSAATVTLTRYFRRTFYDPRLDTPRPGPSLFDRYPRRVRPAVALLLAVACLPFLVLALTVLRTDLHPRLQRYRALTPTDVLKGLAVTRRPFAFARLLARQVVRRLTAA